MSQLKQSDRRRLKKARDQLIRIAYEHDDLRASLMPAIRRANDLSDADIEEGKMSDILGVPEEEDIGDAYDGSPKDAAQELVDAVGEDEAAGMINWAANISGDAFLEDMQDALDETGNEE